MTNTTTPIVVDPDPTLSQLATAARYLLSALGGHAIARGWLEAGMVEALTTIALTLAPLGYGVWRTWSDRRRAVVIADAAPDGVAVVRR